MDNLMYSLVGDPKLARQLCLRDASRVACPDDSIAFRHCKGSITLRWAAVEGLQYSRDGNRHLPQIWSSLRLQSPYGAQDSH
jgi:hypothetical protein